MEKPIIAVLGGHHSAGHDQYDCVDHVYCERIVEAGALPILFVQRHVAARRSGC